MYNHTDKDITDNSPDRAVLVGFGVKPQPIAEVKTDLCELEELASAAGAEVVGSTFQIVQKIQSATLIGSGKVEEVAEMLDGSDGNLVIIDHQLSGVQTRNLEKKWKVRVVDRNQLILDIFAQRAQTYEGKLQVELAQLLDQMPRMVGAWLGSLSRLGGGIGTRGPGETAIETDRRVVLKKVDQIKARLEKVRKNREQRRQRRVKNSIPSFALIGYTNSGKSTVLNALTNSNVLSKDQVFATLDPTTRQLYLEKHEAVITDTVGFISKLPTQLIESFKATLEESAEADILLHVIDLSNPSSKQQIKVVDDLIEEFGWGEKPILHIFNKTDLVKGQEAFKVDAFPRVFISAQNKEGFDLLKRKMSEMIEQLSEEVSLYFSNEHEHKIFDLARQAQILVQEKGTEGTFCKSLLTKNQLSIWKEFLVE